jgi:hypothetical protein
LAALNTPGAYVQLMTPTGLAVAGPSNAIAELGTASWGPVNQAMGPFGDPGSAAFVFGQFNAALFKTDQYDLMRAVMQSMEQAQTDVSLNCWLTRISDGTDAAATITLKDTTSGTALNGITLPAKYTGTGGNSITLIIAAAGPANVYNVTVISSIGGQNYSEAFLGIAGATGADSPFWANLNQALLFGNQSRGPSQVLGTPTSVSATAKDPATGTFTLTGGTDGRSGVTSASFFGSDVVGNRQGIYTMRSLNIVPAFIYCAGLVDSTKYATIQSFCLQEIVRAVLPFASGTSTATAVTNRQTNGISDKRIMYARNWIYWTDPVSGSLLFTDPVAIMIGFAASLSPQLSPLNKPIFGVVGSEETSPIPGDEIGQLNSNGIWIISNPCLQSAFWGIASATTTSANPQYQSDVSVARLQDYIGLQMATVLAPFVGQPQGERDPDPIRSAIKNNIDELMQQFYDDSLIVDWESECDAKLNPAAQVQAGYCRATLEYVPFATIKYLVLNLGISNQLSAGQALNQANQGG